MSVAAFVVIVHGYTITVCRHAIAETGIGLAGYFEAVLSDGRVLFAVGRWDDELIADLDQPWLVEHVWIDGDLAEAEEEDSFYIKLTPETGTAQANGVLVEDIAHAIHQAELAGAAS